MIRVTVTHKNNIELEAAQVRFITLPMIVGPIQPTVEDDGLSALYASPAKLLVRYNLFEEFAPAEWTVQESFQDVITQLAAITGYGGISTEARRVGVGIRQVVANFTAGAASGISCPGITALASAYAGNYLDSGTSTAPAFGFFIEVDEEAQTLNIVATSESGDLETGYAVQGQRFLIVW